MLVLIMMILQRIRVFHRILFKPSAIRYKQELTQLQSILQNKIERFGSHMFKEGAIILGARTNYDNQYFGVRVEDTNPNGSGVSRYESFRAESLGKFYKGQTSGVVGKIVNTSQKTTEDALTLHVKYQATGNSGSTFYTEFQDGEILDEVTTRFKWSWWLYICIIQIINLKFSQ